MITRRHIGTAMIAVGVAGMLSGAAAAVAGWQLVGQIETSVDDTLTITDRALTTVDESIAVSAEVVETVRSGLGTIDDTVLTLEDALRDTSVVLTDTGGVADGSLPDTLDAVVQVLPTIEDVASSIDGALRFLARAPFGPDYDPDVPFDEAIAQLETALVPLAADLRGVSDGLATLGTSSEELADELVAIGEDVDALDTRLDDVALVLAQYEGTAADATALARQSRADLEDSARVTRWLVVLGGIVFAAGQLVPLWLGRELRRGSGTGLPLLTDPAMPASADDADVDDNVLVEDPPTVPGPPR